MGCNLFFKLYYRQSVIEWYHLNGDGLGFYLSREPQYILVYSSPLNIQLNY